MIFWAFWLYRPAERIVSAVDTVAAGGTNTFTESDSERRSGPRLLFLGRSRHREPFDWFSRSTR
jgi:hypothetical protein